MCLRVRAVVQKTFDQVDINFRPVQRDQQGSDADFQGGVDVGLVTQKQLDDVGLVFTRGDKERSETGLVPMIDIRAGLEKQSGNFNTIVFLRREQWCLPQGIGEIDIGLAGQQQFHHFGPVVADGKMERSVAA